MKRSLSLLLLAGLAALPLAAQQHSAEIASGTLEVAVTYDAARNGASNSFWLQGGSVQLESRFWRGLGGVAEVSGLHAGNMHGSGVGLDLVTATFGPRYTMQVHDLARSIDARRRIEFYGEALGGIASGFNSVFPATSAAEDSETGSAMQFGGGLNYALSKRFSVRVLDLSWLRTTLPNGADNVQNNLRLGAGLVWKLSRR